MYATESAADLRLRRRFKTMNISYLIIPDHVRDGSLQVVVICVLLIMSKKRKSSTMVLHLKYFQAAEIDLKGAKILAKENLLPPTLYHLQ